MTILRSILAVVLLVSSSAIVSVAHAEEKSVKSQDTESSDDSSRVAVPKGKYITGGVLASTIGFGIGHAVQGRYSEKGWIFTATEVASLGIAIAGASSSCKVVTDSYGFQETKCTDNGLMAIGLIGLIGFRVWEIVDSWIGARPVDDGPKAYIIPDPKSPSIGVSWNF